MSTKTIFHFNKHHPLFYQSKLVISPSLDVFVAILKMSLVRLFYLEHPFEMLHLLNQFMNVKAIVYKHNEQLNYNQFHQKIVFLFYPF